MSNDIFAAAVVFVMGAGVGVLNYFISSYVLKKHSKNFASVTVVRQIIQVGFIFAVYLVGKKTPWDATYLLIGAVLGISVAMILSTKMLLKLNSEIKHDSGKEEDSNG